MRFIRAGGLLKTRCSEDKVVWAGVVVSAGMYLRRCYRAREGKRHAYWALVKSERTASGPRQKVVAYLGDLDEAGRLGVQRAAGGGEGSLPSALFDSAPFDSALPVSPPAARYVEVDLAAVRVDGTRRFGGAWLALQIINTLQLQPLLDRLMPAGREEVPWSIMSLILVICRLCDPSSELRIAEHLYPRSALPDLLGVSSDKINDDRLYRALDQLLPHKEELEKHLKNRLGELFNLSYDLLLYDVTSILRLRSGQALLRRPVQWQPRGEARLLARQSL